MCLIFVYSMEEDYLQWVPTQLKAIGQFFGVAVDASSQNKPHIPLFNASYVESDNAFKGEMTSKLPRKWQHVAHSEFQEVNPAKSFDSKHPYYSHLQSSKSLFVDSKDNEKFGNDALIQIKSKRIQVNGSQITIPRQCYHMEFDIGSSGLTYKTGDHLGVWANNDSGQVEKLLNLLKVEKPDGLVKLLANAENPLSANAKIPFPLPCSVRDVFTYYLDIIATLKQHHFLVSFRRRC
jgi:NADPH-ferrihemoprotein reductase